MPSISVRNITISYTDVNSDKDVALLFIHGNSSSSNVWKSQLSSSLFAGYRLIAPDLPGCGGSGRSQDPISDYAIDGQAITIAGFINELELDNLILVGHSLGGHIAIECIPHLKTPLAGLVLFGAPPITGAAGMGAAFNPVAEFAVALSGDPEPEGIKAFFDVSIANSEISRNDFIQDFNQTDRTFREAIGKSVQENRIADEVEMLVSSRTNTAIFNGEDDPFINADYLDSLQVDKWRDKVHTIPEAGHFPQVEQPEKFNALLVEYVEEIVE